MIKSELIDRLCAQYPEIDPKQAALAVNTLLESMSDELANGMRIEIRDFGSWFIQYCAKRNAHNPKTGEKVLTEEKYKPRFKAGKALRERVDASKHIPIQNEDSIE